LKRQQWISLKNAPQGQNLFGLAAIDSEKVLLVAGRDTHGPSFTRRVNIYNTREDSWTTGPLFPLSGSLYLVKESF